MAWIETPVRHRLALANAGFDPSLYYAPRAVRIAGIPGPVSAPTPNFATFRRIEVPRGSRGTEATMRKMAELIVEGARDPFFIQQTRGIVRGIPSKDYEAEASAILLDTKQNVDYRGDSYDVDWLQSPGWTDQVEGQGDCDDLAILICARNMAIGHGCALRAVKLDPQNPSEFSHVYPLIGVRGAQGMGGGQVAWWAQDAVPDVARLGWEPPRSMWIGEPRDLIVAAP